MQISHNSLFVVICSLTHEGIHKVTNLTVEPGQFDARITIVHPHNFAKYIISYCMANTLSCRERLIERTSLVMVSKILCVHLKLIGIFVGIEFSENTGYHKHRHLRRQL